MTQTILKNLLNSKYRREMWDNTQKIIEKLEKTLPISSAYLLGSFTTKKRRPADVDLILLLKVRGKKQNSKWSLDLTLAPENKYGDFVLEDAKRWMKQKYGKNKSAVIRLK